MTRNTVSETLEGVEHFGTSENAAYSCRPKMACALFGKTNQVAGCPLRI